MDKPPERSEDELREEELLREAVALRETLRQAIEAANRLSTTDTTPTTPLVVAPVEPDPEAMPPTIPPRELETKTLRPSSAILDQHGKSYDDTQAIATPNTKFKAEKIEIERKIKQDSPLDLSRLKILKEKARDLNERYASATQKEQKAILYNQLETAQKEYRKLEEKFDTHPQITERDKRVVKLRELREVIRSLNEKYISEPQREQKAILYNRLEQAQREYRKLEEEVDRTTIKATPAKSIPTTEPVPTAPTKTPVTTPDTNTSKTTEKIVGAEAIKTEIKNLSKEDREKLSIGLHNIGFIIEKKKSDWFAKIFDWISKKGDQKGTIARFTRALRNSSRKNSEMAQKKIGAGKESPTTTKLSNIAYLSKNILRPMYLIGSITGISPSAAQRLVMAGGMISASVTGAMKEARLENEDVLRETLIEDADKAAEEAWAIYENARKRAGTDGNVSALELKTAYIHEIPRDLQERLRKTTSGPGLMVQAILRKHLEFDVNRLNNDIEKIEKSDKLSPEKIKAQQDQLLRRWEKRLTDYDRILTQTGTVDEYAMVARYAEATSQNVVRAMTAHALYLTLERVWDGLAHILSGPEAHDIELISTPPPTSSARVEPPEEFFEPEAIETPSVPSEQVQVKPSETPSPVADPETPPDSVDTLAEARNEMLEKSRNKMFAEVEFGGKPDFTPSPTEPPVTEFSPDNLNAYAEPSPEPLATQFDPKNLNPETMASAPEVEVDVKEPSPTAEELSARLRAKMEAEAIERYRIVQRGEIPGEVNPYQTPRFDEYGRRLVYTPDGNHIMGRVDQNGRYTPEFSPTSGGETPGTYRPYNDPRGPRMNPGMTTEGAQEFYPELSSSERLIIQTHSELAENPFDLTGKQLIEVYNVSERNLDTVMPGELMKEWNVVKYLDAKSIYNDETLEKDEKMGRLFSYLHKLKEETGLSPRGRGLFHRAEDTQEYIMRALQKAAEEGVLDKVKLG